MCVIIEITHTVIEKRKITQHGKINGLEMELFTSLEFKETYPKRNLEH